MKIVQDIPVLSITAPGARRRERTKGIRLLHSCSQEIDSARAAASPRRGVSLLPVSGSGTGGPIRCVGETSAGEAAPHSSFIPLSGQRLPSRCGTAARSPGRALFDYAKSRYATEPLSLIYHRRFRRHRRQSAPTCETDRDNRDNDRARSTTHRSIGRDVSRPMGLRTKTDTLQSPATKTFRVLSSIPGTACHFLDRS